MKIFDYIKDLMCPHNNYLVITNTIDYKYGSYRFGSYIACKDCGRIIKSDQFYRTNVINFVPRGK